MVQLFPRSLRTLMVAATAALGLISQIPAHAADTTGLWQDVQKAGVLRCGAAVAAPYVMRDASSGTYRGYFVDLCRDFGERVLKVKVEFVDTNWDNLVAGLQSSKWDMAMALNQTPERAMAVTFSVPATDYQVSLVVNKDNPKFAGASASVADYDKPDVIDVEQVGLTISADNARALATAGVKLKGLINEQLRVQHPLIAELNEVAYVMFRHRLDDHTWQTCTTLPPGRVDRSPCGTGSSANLATLSARGRVQEGDVLTSRSTIGGEFKVQLLGHTEVGGRAAVLPRVTGRAWLYGLQQLGVDPTDPLGAGFMLSDTWGEGF
ncbi:proline racemase family protein [Pseudomonas putida]